jgi:hypothetical protein
MLQRTSGLRLALHIDLDNAAFWRGKNEDRIDSVEIAAKLNDVGLKIIDGHNDGIIRDANGNRVGEWDISTCTCTSTTDDAFDGVDPNCPVHGDEAAFVATSELVRQREIAELNERIVSVRAAGCLACVSCGANLGPDDGRDPDCVACMRRADAEEAEALRRLAEEDDDDGCPVGDPECTSRNDECHDACVAPQTYDEAGDERSFGDPYLDDDERERARKLTPHVGARVKLVVDVERFPHDIVPAGTLGTITLIDDSIIAVHLDDHFAGFDAWDNELMFGESDDVIDEFERCVVVIEASRLKRGVEMIVHPELGGYVETLVFTERDVERVSRELRHHLNTFDDGIYVATDGWMLPSWNEMYCAMRGKAEDITSDYVLACRVALAHCAGFSPEHIDDIQRHFDKRRPAHLMARYAEEFRAEHNNTHINLLEN